MLSLLRFTAPAHMLKKSQDLKLLLPHIHGSETGESELIKSVCFLSISNVKNDRETDIYKVAFRCNLTRNYFLGTEIRATNR